MKISSLPIDVKKMVDGAMIVGNGRPYNDWIEGVKQEKGGFAYEVIFPNVDYEKGLVKVPGKQQSSILYVGKPIPVLIEGARVKAYQNFKTGKLELSISAEKITVDKPNIKITRGQESV